MQKEAQTDIAATLNKAGLQAELLRKNLIVGQSKQVRQTIRCAVTGQFIAFFCRNVIPSKSVGIRQSTAKTEHNAYVTTADILPTQQAAAEQWIAYMYQEFPYHTDHDHPSC